MTDSGFLRRIFRRIRSRTPFMARFDSCTWHGDFPDWRSACAVVGGYDQGAILETVAKSVGLVLGGHGRYERDGVVFSDDALRWPLAAALALAARDGSRPMRVLDVGGSLGSAWLQHRRLLAGMDCEWSIVEQPPFAERGESLFRGRLGVPRFFTSVAEAAGGRPVDLAILGGVLQYLEHPFAVLDEVTAAAPRWMLIDRTAEHMGDQDRITIQHVPPAIYPASYACRFFARDSIPRSLGRSYRLVAECPADDPTHVRSLRFIGWLFERVAER
jgi:putative methyltransferase (TIGR04325 family)